MRRGFKDLIRILPMESRTRKQTKVTALLFVLLAFTSAQAAEKLIALPASPEHLNAGGGVRKGFQTPHGGASLISPGENQYAKRAEIALGAKL